MKQNKQGKRGIVLLGMLWILMPGAYAKEKETFKHWKAELSGGLNNYEAWEIEPSISYRPIRYFGLSLGAWLGDRLYPEGLGGESKDKQWRWNTARDTDGNYFFALRAGLQFLSPPVWLDESKDWAIAFSVSPGLTLPLPANKQFYINYFPNRPGLWVASRTEQVKNEGARQVFYHLKSALWLEVDNRLSFSIGYTFSNFDLYGGSRRITIEGKRLMPEKHAFMHTVAIGMGYCF